MNIIVMIIRPERLKAIEEAVKKHHPRFMTVSEVLDPQEPGRVLSYRGRPVGVMARKLRVEIAVEGGDVAPVVTAIRQAVSLSASPGTTGDKLFILQLQEGTPIGALDPAPISCEALRSRADGHRLTRR
jgi:nitrogen regulatory protein PII